MTKIIVPSPKIDDIPFYLDHELDGFIIGIKGFSENFNNLVDIKDLKKYISLIKKNNKEIFVFLNKLYYEDEIEKLKELIEILIKNNVESIGFQDFGVLNLLKDFKFSGKMIWISNHLGTNSSTINYLKKQGVETVLLSTEITKDEIISIKKNTTSKIITQLYGHLLMATSSRKLLTNYFDYINKPKEKNRYIIQDKQTKEKYIILEKENSYFFTNKILNGLQFFSDFIKSNIDYVFLDDYLINTNDFYNIIEAYTALRRSFDDTNFINMLNEVVVVNTKGETFNGFFDKKTVYKVKDYE